LLHAVLRYQHFLHSRPRNLAVVVQATETRCHSVAAASTVAASAQRQNTFPRRDIFVRAPSDVRACTALYKFRCEFLGTRLASAPLMARGVVRAVTRAGTLDAYPSSWENTFTRYSSHFCSVAR
jgi:hypothetical protein